MTDSAEASARGSGPPDEDGAAGKAAQADSAAAASRVKSIGARMTELPVGPLQSSMDPMR